MISSVWFAMSLLVAAPTLPADSTTAASAPVDFDTQIVPVLTRYGCNQGSCHGAAIGRGGFKLSLYGGDAASDHRSITWELGGRRVNSLHPQRSLLLRKPTGDLDHGGDYLFDEESAAAELIRRWIAEGAERVERRRLKRVVFSPRQIVLDRVGSATPLRAVAYYDDGSREDVTRWTTWTATDPSAVELDLERHRVSVLRSGRHLLLARFMRVVTPLEVIVPWSETREAPKPEQRESVHLVDRSIDARMIQLGLTPAPKADDATLLRRLMLDLTGRLPSPEVVASYLEDTSRKKSEKLIDSLIGSDEFVALWTYHLATWWRVRTPGRGQGRDVAAAESFHRWIEASLREGVGLDRMARELVTAEGDSHERGAATFYRLAAGARAQAEYFSETLMGVRLRCANCHNHPLDQWTQDDYHGLAALFAGIEQGRIVRDRGKGEVIHPRTSLPAREKIPGVDGTVREGRTELARWLTAADNPYFARSIVNRTWAVLMGRGLVEPVDDLRRSNPATHPELLDRLAGEFRRHDYDLRWLVRTIVTSQAYQRSLGSEGSAFGAEFYPRAYVRPLPAEVLADAIADVTGVSWKFSERSTGGRAVELVDVELPSRALDVFGRCDRSTSCEAAGPKVSGLARTLHLLNGATLNDLLQDPQSRLQRRLSNGVDDGALLDELFVRALGRHPSEAERRHWLGAIEAAGQGGNSDGGADARAKAWEDFLWAMLCCREFVSNH